MPKKSEHGLCGSLRSIECAARAWYDVRSLGMKAMRCEGSIYIWTEICEENEPSMGNGLGYSEGNTSMGRKLGLIYRKVIKISGKS